MRNKIKATLSKLRKTRPQSPAFSDYRGQIVRTLPPLSTSSFKHSDWVYVFALPKSGNAWLSKLIADAMGLSFPNQVTFTHHKFKEEKHLYNTHILRAVCLLRDIRDVFVSLWYFRATPGWRDNAAIFDDIHSFYYEYFISYMNKWDPLEKYPEALVERGVPIIRYEKLWDNTYR
ncbi:hypothetical protein ACFL17_10295, partial [Pseudomonadota bacterium]